MKPIALIVEDRPEVSGIWKAQLDPLQMEIRIVRRLDDAIRIAHEIPPPDLILLDLRLEDADAPETLAAIKVFKKIAPDVVIVVISGFLLDSYVHTAIANGAAAVREKMSFNTQTSLWYELQSILHEAPPQVKDKLSFQTSLIQKLTSALLL